MYVSCCSFNFKKKIKKNKNLVLQNQTSKLTLSLSGGVLTISKLQKKIKILGYVVC